MGFAHNRGIERRYAAQLAKVAREVGKLAERFVDDVPGLLRALKDYAAKLEPWAAQVADRFIGEVDKANARAWAEKSQTIAKALKGDVAKSAIGLAAQERHFAQVTLITSLPLEAATRAQKLAEDAARGGKRAGDVREAILETAKVTASRAQLIARTEIAKANAALTEARAQMAGITHYIWRTMEDEDVRESHAALEGQVFAFDAPPVVDEGGSYHPGGCYNCFLGDTPVYLDAGVRRILRAPYSGVIVDVHLGGVVFRATPNHPILTRSGWVAAGKLKRGDEVVARGLPAIGEHDVNNAPATFEQVYLALAPAAEAIAGVKFDFYGDRPAGDVNCITINDELLHRLKTSGLQGGEKLALPFADGGVITGDGVGGKVTHTLGAGGSSDGAQFFGAGVGKAQPICGTTAAHWYPVLKQDADDGAARAAKTDGDGLAAFAGFVAGNDVGFREDEPLGTTTPPLDSDATVAHLDAQDIGMTADSGGGVFEHGTGAEQFLRVEQVVFWYSESCHVYTLETLQRWYRVTPAGIIAKNCRCFAEPILTQPDTPLELTAPGTTLEQRAAEVATTIARSVAARKAAATRAAKKAETVASRAIAAREAKAAAQAEKGAAALQQAAKKAAAAAEKAAAEAASRQAAMAHLEAAGLRVQSAGGRVVLAGDTYRHKDVIKAAGGKWDGAAKAWTMSEKQAAKLAAKLAPAPLAPPSAEVARIMELTGFAREKAEKRAAEIAAERAAKELAKKTATTFTQEAYEATRASLQARGVTLAPAMEGTFSGGTIARAMSTKHTQVTRWHLYGDTYAHRAAIRAAGGKWLPEAQVWEVTTAQAEKLAAQLAK